MKTALTAITLCLSLLSSPGQLAIYKTLSHGTSIGGGKTTKLITKGFVIVDYSALPSISAIGVGAFTINGQKLFSIVPFQNYLFLQVTGANGVIYDVVATAQNPGTQFAGEVLQSAFYQGKETTVTIDAGGPRNLPRTVSISGQAIAQGPAVIVAGVTAGTGTLDVKGSLASNNAGETAAAAAARLGAVFAAAGYTQFTLPPP